ncbi:M1 family aminopeptidase [Flindersiella endophytica]
MRAPVRALPWKDRPVVKLCFDVPADRQLVTGHESVTFRPDARTCELVFRAWPNKPETAASGNRLDVGQVTVDGKAATPRIEAGGAPEGEPGTLVRVPLATCAKAGQKLSIELDFALRLGADTPERVGYSTGDLTAWLATAYPLLAWERGHGWATDPAVDLLGETVTSEEFQLAELRVIAPSADTVFGTGKSLGEQPGPKAGTTEHRFSAPAVRDVTVSVGRFKVEERTIGTTRLHVAARADARFPASVWADETERAVTRLAARFGPFPYDDLWITVVPDIGSGIEFPGAIQFGDVDPKQFAELVPHEVAHMWFYGLVGNNQARDPWLDESFAEYAEVLVNGTDTARLSFLAPPPVRDRVGESMEWYAEASHRALYGPGVYRQGAAMLLKARQAVGPAKWDQLIRAYIDANAHRIVDDEDVRKAFASEPEALSILREYGAFAN